MPGNLSATPVEDPVTITDGYPLDVPLCYYFGHVTPSENQELFKVQLGRLAGLLQQRVATSGECERRNMWVPERLALVTKLVERS